MNATTGLALRSIPQMIEERPFSESLGEDVRYLKRIVGNLTTKENPKVAGTGVINVTRDDIKAALAPERSTLVERGGETVIVDQELADPSDKSERRQRSLANLLAMGADFVDLADRFSRDLRSLVDYFANDIKSIPGQGQKILDYYRSYFKPAAVL